MGLIYTSTPKRKAKKPTAKQRQLQAEWEALLKKYEPKRPIPKSTKPYTPPKPVVRQTPYIPSLDTGITGPCSSAPRHKYTGSAMIGISTLHKSNAVPVFSAEDAKEHSRMRRG